MRVQRPLRLAIVSLGGAAVGLTASRCGTQTQLIVHVSTDVADCNRIDTGIFVGNFSADTNDSAGPRVSKRACERPGFIGSAVFLPTGADDEAFAIKIVTAVDATVTECVAGLKKTCIIERRTVRYEPGAIVRVDVSMDQQCIGVECAINQKCTRGLCVACAECVDPSGGDSGPDGNSSGGVEAGSDSGCPGDQSQCTTCFDGGCQIDCNQKDCNAKGFACPPGRPCSVNCSGRPEVCKAGVDCSKATTCDVLCSGDTDTCHKGTVRCGTGSCRVRCTGAPNVCHDVTIEQQDASALCFECKGTNACDGVVCEVPLAGLTCQKDCSGCKDGEVCKACKIDASAPCPEPQ
jgi:hypothetical protein